MRGAELAILACVEQREFLDSFDLVQQVLEREVIEDIRKNVRERLTLAPAE